MAEWAAKRVSDLPTLQERAWKPNLLVPAESSSQLRGAYRFIHDITYPKGSVKIVGLTTLSPKRSLEPRLNRLTQSFREDGVFSSWTIIEAQKYAQGFMAGMQAMGGVFLKPNIVFLQMSIVAIHLNHSPGNLISGEPHASQDSGGRFEHWEARI